MLKDQLMHRFLSAYAVKSQGFVETKPEIRVKTKFILTALSCM
jgi:hypothetical protein